MHNFKTVDLLEPCGKLIVEARRRLSKEVGSALPAIKRQAGGSEIEGIRNFYPHSLQDFTFCAESSRTLGVDETAQQVDDFVRGEKKTTLEEEDLQAPLIYDCIWNQWVLLYLTDEDLITYLEKCKSALTQDGFIFCKENVLLPPQSRESVKTDVRYQRGFEIDVEDNGITRTDERYRALFFKAGLQIECAMKQGSWPQDLYPVYMYVLKPRKN